MDNPTLLVVDDKHRLITKRLRRVGWQTTMWQRFSCGEHVEGSCWPESDDKDWFAAAVVRAPTTKASLAMILHVVAAKVQFGGKVWIYGAATEGLKSIIPDLPKVCASESS
jgi:16S rRNA G1207 methylase RsmC